MTPTQPEVVVGGRKLRLSNLDKVLYPRTGFTKGQVIDYYARIAPAVLPHLADRPLTLKRYPNGVDAPYFYEKRCPPHRPSWLRTTPMWSDRNGRDIDFCVIADLPSLVWAANLADLELHTPLARAGDLERPTMMVFDLDPGEPADVLDCADVALWTGELLRGIGLSSVVKTSGSKGLQVYVPLNVARVTYDDTKAFSHAVAMLLERAHPDRVVSVMRKDRRPGKVYIDWAQNDHHKTTVTVWSLRARERPTVSTPVTWDEVKAAARRRDGRRLVFDSDEAIRRFEAHGDPFAPVLTMRQKLPRHV